MGSVDAAAGSAGRARPGSGRADVLSAVVGGLAPVHPAPVVRAGDAPAHRLDLFAHLLALGMRGRIQISAPPTLDLPKDPHDEEGMPTRSGKQPSGPADTVRGGNPFKPGPARPERSSSDAARP